MTTAYCPACRAYFTVDANPPYGVIHKSAVFEKSPETGESVEVRPVAHLHAITREPVQQVVTLTANEDGTPITRARFTNTGSPVGESGTDEELNLA